MIFFRYCAQHGITARIVGFFIALVIVPYLILAGIVYLFFQTYTVNRLGETTMDTMSMVEHSISAAMLSSEKDTMSFYYGGYVDRLDANAEWSVEDRTQWDAALGAFCFSDTRVLSAYMVTERFTLHGGENYPELLSLMEPYQAEIKEAGGACLWYPTDQLHGRANELHYVLARSLNSRTNSGVGVLYCVLSDSMIREAYEQMTSAYTTRYLTDRSGCILYASDGSPHGQTLDLSSTDPSVIRSYQAVKNLSGGNIILVTNRIPRIGWYCAAVIDIQEVTRDAFVLWFPFLLISAVYILFLLIMLYLLRQYVFIPLGRLTDAMDRYARQELDSHPIGTVGTGEIKSLSEHFNRMTLRISGLMRDYKEETDEKNRQKLKTMAAQLTPHFIYNALNTIKWMAVLNHQEHIRHLVESLVSIFMNAARVDDETYTVRDELDLIRNYAVIQKVRFMNFDLAVDAREESLDCRIRKLLVQPVVENAIVHGMSRGKAREGTVTVRVWLEDCLRIAVIDHGVGFDVEEWRHRPKKDDSHTNIGLHNIEQMIQLEYGTPYGIAIDSTLGQGTAVTYALPIIRKEPEHDTDNHCG